MEVDNWQLFPNRQVPLELLFVIFENISTANCLRLRTISKAWYKFFWKLYPDWKFQCVIEFRRKIKSGQFFLIPQWFRDDMKLSLSREDIQYVFAFAKLDGFESKALVEFPECSDWVSSSIIWESFTTIMSQFEAGFTKIHGRSSSQKRKLPSSFLSKEKMTMVHYFINLLSNFGQIMMEHPEFIPWFKPSNLRTILPRIQEYVKKGEFGLSYIHQDLENQFDMPAVYLVLYFIWYQSIHDQYLASFQNYISMKKYSIQVLSKIELTVNVLLVIVKTDFPNKTQFLHLPQVTETIKKYNLWENIANHVDLMEVPMHWLSFIPAEIMCLNKKTAPKQLHSFVKLAYEIFTQQQKLNFIDFISRNRDRISREFLDLWNKQFEQKPTIPFYLEDDEMLPSPSENEESDGEFEIPLDE